MKNTMKKGIMLLVLAVLTAGGVFAQRVGDTIQAGGSSWTVETVSGNRMTLLKTPTLDGVWVGSGGITTITISGSTGVFTRLGSSAMTQDAISKGYVKVGDTFYRNLRKTGDLTWTGQNLAMTFNYSAPNVATGTVWSNITSTLSADGQTFRDNGGSTYTRQ
jgi:hypothetical protein